MIKSKNQNNSFQFIPKTINEQSKDHLKKSDAKLSYDEIRNIVEHGKEKEIPKKQQGKQHKYKFDIV